MHFHLVNANRHQPLALACSLKAVVLLSGLLLAAAGHAQTLGGALEQAWSRHPKAAAWAAQASAAQAGAEVAAGLTPAPATLSLSSVNDRFITATGKDSWEFEVAMPMWLPGQRAARGREAVSAQADVTARRSALRLQLAGELREAWWALGAARQTLALAAQREATARALSIDVLRRVKVGELARVDANLAKNDTLAAESGLLEARSTLRQAEQNYRLLTGAEAPPELAQEVLAQQPAPEATHPQLAAAQVVAELAQARLNVALQTHRDAPELALKLVRERGDFNSSFTHSVGVKLMLPLSSGARVRQETSAAEAEAAQAQAELARVQQHLAFEVARAQRERELAQQQSSTALARRELMADSLRLIEKSFALGEVDLPTLLSARSRAFETEALVNRQRIVLAASVSRVNQFLGVMP